MHYHRRDMSMITGRRVHRPLLERKFPAAGSGGSTRGMAFLAVRLLRNVLKIRYLVLGSAVGGGYTLKKSYEEWVDAIPDLSWMDQYIPSGDEWNSVRSTLLSIKDKVMELELDPQLRAVAENKIQNMRNWLDTKLEEAYVAAQEQEKLIEEKSKIENIVDKSTSVNAISFGKSETKEDNSSKSGERNPTITEEDLWEMQMKYQRELERLERENKSLRQQVLLRSQSSQPVKKVKSTLIDMYSDVLDELTDYDTNYKTQDHLPRVVVIGDQSSGKTSVLEMIAQARIFPRGAGEMMTRSPVKVTLSEGPYHIAQFKDSSREFDLTKEFDLAELRREVELRMRNLTKGKTVSNDVISMTVKGPGLQRMVLVDLPGIISTNTLGMEENTKDAIYQIAKLHMSNPNAIILCIQDGSVDAERSNVTDLVSQMDPQGKRTIFVLTKVDLAEDNLTNPNRIKQILAGELFPMKALGYFAVVTGRGSKNESIQQIREYEQNFFKSSKLFNSKFLKSTQMTTRNLSMAVSECFWKMVQETVEQQADAFKAQRFNLESEWKNKYPRLRVLDRDELFEKARGEILDEVINLSEVSVKQWEDLISANLWNKVADYVFEHIYLFAAESPNNGEFSTRVDIRLYQWTEQELAKVSVEAGWETLQQELRNLVERNKSQKEHDHIFDELKAKVVDEALQRHQWEGKACDVLKVLQLNTLADQTITDKQQWESAVRFLESSVKSKLQETEKQLRQMMGPSSLEQWYKWSRLSEEAKKRNAVKNELEKILYNDPEHSSVLSPDELTTVRNTLQRSSVSCNNEFISETWKPIFRRNFLIQTLEKIPYYSRGFYLYRQGIDILMTAVIGLSSSEEIRLPSKEMVHTYQDYSEVILYWRIQQMLRVTVNSLRQQIVNREAHRIDEEIKDVLEDFSRDKQKKEELLTGRRVTLAEELKRVKQIQEKLEEFIKALNQEKKDGRRV